MISNVTRKMPFAVLSLPALTAQVNTAALANKEKLIIAVSSDLF